MPGTEPENERLHHGVILSAAQRERYRFPERGRARGWRRAGRFLVDVARNECEIDETLTAVAPLAMDAGPDDVALRAAHKGADHAPDPRQNPCAR